MYHLNNANIQLYNCTNVQSYNHSSHMCENNSLIQRMVCQTWLINVHLSMVLLLHNRIVIKAPLGKAHQTVARDCKAVRTCVLFYCNIFKTPFLHNFVRNKQCEINKSQREREREIAAKRRSQPE